MTCNNCANGIKVHLEKNLIENVNVNFSLAEVSCNENSTSNKIHIINLIEEIGYKVKKKEK
jgi:copper chaperone CopZ